jgi:hypothetical protein
MNLHRREDLTQMSHAQNNCEPTAEETKATQISAYFNT